MDIALGWAFLRFHTLLSKLAQGNLLACLQGAGPNSVRGFQKHLAFITAHKALTQHWINVICKSELIMQDTTSPLQKRKEWVNIVAHDLCNCTESRLGIPWFLALCVGSRLLQSSLSDSDEQEEKRLISSSTASTWSGGDSLLLLTVKTVGEQERVLKPLHTICYMSKARQHAAGCNWAIHLWPSDNQSRWIPFSAHGRAVVNLGELETGHYLTPTPSHI